MRRPRAIPSVAAAAPLALLLSGCPSLDGFVTDAGAADVSDAGDGGGPGAGFLPVDDAVRFCSKALTCPNLDRSTIVSLHVPVDPKKFAACVAWLANELPSDQLGLTQRRQALECSATAATCSGANACMWFEFVSPTDPRCIGYTGGMSGECAAGGTTTLYCDSSFGAEFIEHCNNTVNFSGSSCLTGNQGLDFCAVGNVSCQSACSGSFYTQCDQGLLTGIDCNALGLSCGKDPSQQIFECLSNGAYKACTAAASVACAADHVSVCDGVYESEFDCDVLGGTCDQSGSLPRCALPAEACSPYDSDENVCTGDSISLCVNGQPLAFDCTTLGMHCVNGSAGVSAHCE